MTRPCAEATQRFIRSYRMEQLCGFALIFFLARGTRGPGDALQKRLDRICGDVGWCRRRRLGRRRRSARGRALPFSVIIFFNNIREYELVSMTRDGAHEARFAGVVAEYPADRPDRLTERAVGDDDVGPHAVEDVAPVNRLAAPFD